MSNLKNNNFVLEGQSVSITNIDGNDYFQFPLGLEMKDSFIFSIDDFQEYKDFYYAKNSNITGEDKEIIEYSFAMLPKNNNPDIITGIIGFQYVPMPDDEIDEDVLKVSGLVYPNIALSNKAKDWIINDPQIDTELTFTGNVLLGVYNKYNFEERDFFDGKATLTLSSKDNINTTLSFDDFYTINLNSVSEDITLTDFEKISNEVKEKLPFFSTEAEYSINKNGQITNVFLAKDGKVPDEILQMFMGFGNYGDADIGLVGVVDVKK